jgi:hypothetical protein
MNRRGFLASLLAAPLVAVPALDLGRRIFLPPRGGWPAGTLNLAMLMKAKRVLEAQPVVDRYYIDYRAEFIAAFEERHTFIRRDFDRGIIEEFIR